LPVAGGSGFPAAGSCNSYLKPILLALALIEC